MWVPQRVLILLVLDAYLSIIFRHDYCVVEIHWIFWVSQTQVEESHSETSKAHERSVVQEIQLVQFCALPLQGASWKLLRIFAAATHTCFNLRFSGQVYDVIWRISATATIGPIHCSTQKMHDMADLLSLRCLHLPQRGCSPNLECISA